MRNRKYDPDAAHNTRGTPESTKTMRGKTGGDFSPIPQKKADRI